MNDDFHHMLSGRLTSTATTIRPVINHQVVDRGLASSRRSFTLSQHAFYPSWAYEIPGDKNWDTRPNSFGGAYIFPAFD